MKHIRFQFLTLLSATALTLTSCDLIGSLDGIEPEHVVTDDNYITDVSTAQTALNGVYASWRSTGVSYLRYGMSSMAHTQTQAMVMGAEEFAAENIETNNSNVEAAYTSPSEIAPVIRKTVKYKTTEAIIKASLKELSHM